MNGLPSKQLIMDASDPKRKKLSQKTVVIVRSEANLGKHRGEAPPDYWSWRKYGQKPIKDSPYPRKAYYRCSSLKGCSAKKRVERCKKDDSLVIITYTSNHNHPGPVLSTLKKAIYSSHTPFLKEDCCSSEKNTSAGDDDESSSLKCLQESKDKVQQGDTLPSSIEPLNYCLEENDIFDELEELPLPSSFNRMVRNSIFDERIVLPP